MRKKKSILLIGVGNFGKHIAEELCRLGHEVMAVDSNEQRVNDILPIVTSAQIGDSTSETFLRGLDVKQYDVCIVTIGGDFQSSLETTNLLKELGAKVVVSRTERDGQAKFLLRNGADEIVYPEKQLASWLAIRYSADHILDYIELDDDCSIFEVTIPKAWIGKSILEVDVRKKYNINIIGVRENGKLNVSVSPGIVLTESKTLLVLGEYKALQKCFDL
ncbi:MAG: TrkA family potassium uptake protein [Clostridia bacterium]|nr:TrkA family potassium uptake protein [Clostridia bacterium]